MSFFLGLLAIAFGCLIIKYRERVGDMVGDPAWAGKIGGIYNVLILFGIFMCFWGLATITGTSDILFAPIVNLFPRQAQPSL